jgi:hypothetical protein
VYTTSPTDADTDDDGLSDGAEASIWGTSPNAGDTDADGLNDAREVLDFNTDPLLDDTDGDQLLDGEEVILFGTSPLNVDTEGDGLFDGEEIDLGTNPLLADTDGDGLTDEEEVYYFGTSPTNPDMDGDGIDDGDEIYGLGTDPARADTDNDGLNDFDEFMEDSDPNDPDTDADDLEDGEEVFVWLTSPIFPDTDGDTLTDGEEVYLYGTSPTEADTDGGGLDDAAELADGRNPLDPSDDVDLAIGPRFLIVEVVDHLSYTNARFVEIYNSGDQAGSLDGYQIARYSNGSTTATNVSITTGITLQPGQSFVVASSNSTLNGFPFVFPAYVAAQTQFNSNINGNGDDAYALRFSGTTTDVYGVVGQQPAAGSSWNYQDSVAKRNANVVAPSATFTLSEWTIYAGDTQANPFNRN